MKKVTCIAPVNIAVIKYWGKRDEELILPLNDSISATLSTDQMCAKTTITASPEFKESRFWLNDKEEDFNDNKRLQNCLREVKNRATTGFEVLNWNIHIYSVNNFPTAAGLASSAAGYACLVSTLATLYQVKGDISALARIGSGSACRSVYGGWVQWNKGILPTGEDSIATPIAPASHWPEMRVIILVVNDSKKKYSSTDGMRRGVETSSFLKVRTETIVPGRAVEMKKAILERNFEDFARLTMQDSNQFHSVCLDTYPPCFYMNDVSRGVVEMVHSYNNYKGSNKVAYTFDAGPNACLFLLEQDLQEFACLINKVFPPQGGNVEEDYFKGERLILQDTTLLREKLNLTQLAQGSLKYVIYTRLGEGPQVLSN